MVEQMLLGKNETKYLVLKNVKLSVCYKLLCNRSYFNLKNHLSDSTLIGHVEIYPSTICLIFFLYILMVLIFKQKLLFIYLIYMFHS